MTQDNCEANKLADGVAEVFARNKKFTRSWINRWLWLLFVITPFVIMFCLGIVYEQSKQGCFTDILKFYLH